MLLGLTTDQKLGLAGTAAVFIAFSLVTALLIPRYRPDFPGRKGVGLFVVVTLLLTVAMIGAVVVFASEDEGAEAAGHVETELTETETGPSETETGPAETETGQTETTPPTTTAPEEEAPAGDPAAGKALFASNGCGGCHTFEAAGSTGRSARTSTRRSRARTPNSSTSRLSSRTRRWPRATTPASCRRSSSCPRIR